MGAISEAGHDKLRREAHLNRSRSYVNETYGFDGYGCGLCQVGVPCESGIPVGIVTETEGERSGPICRSGREPLRDRRAPVLPEGARGDADAWRRLPPLVLGAVHHPHDT